MRAAIASVLHAEPVDVRALCIHCRRPLCQHDYCQICGPCPHCARQAIDAGQPTPLALLLLEKECHESKFSKRAAVLRRFAPERYAYRKPGPLTARERELIAAVEATERLRAIARAA
jgi:hypothetical protein